MPSAGSAATSKARPSRLGLPAPWMSHAKPRITEIATSQGLVQKTPSVRTPAQTTAMMGVLVAMCGSSDGRKPRGFPRLRVPMETLSASELQEVKTIANIPAGAFSQPPPPPALPGATYTFLPEFYQQLGKTSMPVVYLLLYSSTDTINILATYRFNPLRTVFPLLMMLNSTQTLWSWKTEG